MTKPDTIDVDVDELQALLLEAVASLKSEHGTSVFSLQDDYYWELGPDARYDVYNRPVVEAITLGQLVEELGYLRQMKAENRMSSHALVWLSSLLRYVAERATPVMRRNAGE